MTKNWVCKIGIHNWRLSTTFSNAVPIHVRNELKSDMEVCTRCCKVKRITYEKR